jgi:hypothetical protein
MTDPGMTERAMSDLTDHPGGGRASGIVDRLLGEDWPIRATDKVESLVDQVRVKTTGPALTVSRVLVFGLVAILFAVAALILLLVLVLRVLDIFLDVWLAYLMLGAVLTLGGLLLWRKALRAPA